MITNKEKYDLDGYIKLKNFLPKFFISKIKKELSDIIIEVSNDMSISYNKKEFNYLINETLPKIYKKNKSKGAYIFDVASRLNIFRDLTNYKKTINVISKILKLPSSKIISAKFSLFLFTKHHKSHSIGWHQESGYYSDPNFKEFQYLDKEKSLFTWIPITDTWLGNGALEVLHKSHNEKNIIHNQNPFKDRYKLNPNKRGELYINNLNLLKKKYKEKVIPSKSGDVIIVNSNTLHKSGKNITNKTRVGVIMRFGEKYNLKKWK